MTDQSAVDSLIAGVDSLLESQGPTEQALGTVLERVLAHFNCAVGTLHELDAATDTLYLRADQGLPPIVRDRVRVIPVGKGMAGLAAQQRRPVQVCNLQEDDTGVARPAAKETQMQGSIALPLLWGETLCGTLGVSKPVPYEFSSQEKETLLALASRIGKSFIERSE